MKYPIRYIFGSRAQTYPKEPYMRELETFNDQISMPQSIFGETGIDGLLLDFNCGLRLQIPEGNWHVRIVDFESKYIFFDEDISCATLISAEKYFIDWEIAIWSDGEPVFYHLFDPRGQRVHFRFDRESDVSIATLPYVEQFRRQFECEVSCSIDEPMQCLVREYFPHVTLTSTVPDDSYAAFYIRAASNFPFLTQENVMRIHLLQLGNSILRRIDQPPKVIYRPTKPRSIEEPYVCIGVQTSSPATSWLNADGCTQVVEHLKSLGYRVENVSGEHSLSDQINRLAYADFFIGVSSGLSWLARAVDIPVVLISGITARWYEFDTPYRVYNPLVCHGCFNEYYRAYGEPVKCFLFKRTDRAFECSKNISARQVISAVDRLIADHNLGAQRNET